MNKSIGNQNKVDIIEDYIYDLNPELLDVLLKDHSSNKNIIWATDNYTPFGKGYDFKSGIKSKAIINIHSNVIKPRVNKTKSEQEYRIKQKAEVFTPSWICNKQNNQIDDNWFGRKNVFNKEIENGWVTNKETIVFKNKTWQDYINDIRMEISCGEAPYLVSRYDAVTGKIINIENRIGLLDRKLRIVNENCNEKKDWLIYAKKAVKAIYGYEWQGDNLLLARENILFSVIDYYKAKFSKQISTKELLEFAEIISWNIWQMDGMKYIIPNSCKKVKNAQLKLNLFNDEDEELFECPGCKKSDNKLHNGIYCFIKDWNTNQNIKFIDLVEEVSNEK